MDELTTSIVGIDFPNEDKSKSNRRMKCMLCAPGELVELRLEPTNPFDSNAVSVWSDRGVQLSYVSAERAPLIGKRIKVAGSHLRIGIAVPTKVVSGTAPGPQVA